jgi:hypothetical protein
MPTKAKNKAAGAEKITARMEKLAIDTLRRGHTREDAAAQAGISLERLDRAMAASKSLARRIVKAESDFAVAAIDAIMSGGRAVDMRWMLERRQPAKWEHIKDRQYAPATDLVEAIADGDQSYEAAIALLRRLKDAE